MKNICPLSLQCEHTGLKVFNIIQHANHTVSLSKGFNINTLIEPGAKNKSNIPSQNQQKC